ncbi:hypothetical protein C8F04DRAFT_396183 [Mycena alexandri]|uniref:BTB domain-containing protein n=1 Tax=Mycena alexandri TaxID=1745969 RepID=A0AAD6X3M7_9AGAR|nr:hypothetical protein C8F04DRAFT_396183 [Mycena alexandri]
MHSSVFRVMFATPLPADEPTLEKCPVVVLSGDTAQDWILFLGAMFPKYRSSEVPSLEFFAAVLRLSKKYDCPLFSRRLRPSAKTKPRREVNRYILLSRPVNKLFLLCLQLP